mmetsp:Transcript_7519/g.13548  ORF Transcript_7519/g.13548 Transcript_7519/m.13548 type:complete len:497 (-) Transcript_7519:68-1558(-)
MADDIASFEVEAVGLSHVTSTTRESRMSMSRQSIRASLAASMHDTAAIMQTRPGKSVYLAVNETAQETGNSTTAATAVNLITVMVGAGVLSYPALYSKVGIPLGTLLLGFCAPLSCYVCELLGQTIHNCQLRTGRRIMKLDDVGEACFGRPGALAIKVFLNVYFAAKIAIYMVLIGKNLNYLMPIFPYRAWVLLMTIYMFPVAFMRDISLIEKVSVLGLFSVAVYFITILCGSGKMALMGHSAGMKAFTTVPENPGVMFSVLTAMMFGFGPTDVLATVRRDMASPEELPKALRQSHFLVFAMYLTAGLFGYMGFGGTTVQGNISESMCDFPGCPSTLPDPKLAGRKWFWGLGLAFAVIVNLLVTIPILLYCLFSGIEASYPPDQPMGKVPNAIMRIGVVLFAMLVGLFVPFFLQTVQIMSAALVVPIVIFVPLIFAYRSDRLLGRRPSPVALLGYLGLCVIGVLSLCVGLTEAFADLFAEIERNPSAADPIHNFWN